MLKRKADLLRKVLHDASLRNTANAAFEHGKIRLESHRNGTRRALGPCCTSRAGGGGIVKAEKPNGERLQIRTGEPRQESLFTIPTSVCLVQSYLGFCRKSTT